MPNARKSKSGASLKERAKRAAELTAAQQKERAQTSETKKTEKPHPSKRNDASVAKKSQNKKTAKTKDKKKDSKKEKKPSFFKSRKFIIPLVVIVVLALLVAAIYPMARTYYTSMRQEQQKQAVYDAIQQRNQEIEDLNSSLNTDEGIEDQARKDLGYVQKGETGTVVTNAGEDADTSTELPNQVDSDKIKAPDAWYYDILDKIFMVST